MGFDRKEDFRSSFKEDRKSNEAPKKCRKQGEAAHGRAPEQHGCTAAAVATYGRTHGRAVPPARMTCFFSATYLFPLHFLGDFQAFFREQLREE